MKLHEIQQALEALGVWQAIKKAGSKSNSMSHTIINSVTNFLQLSDVPSTYSGQAGKYLKVTSAEDGLEFGSGGGGIGAVDSVNGQTGDVSLNQDHILDGITNKQFSATNKTKLAGIEAGANNYVHPATHSADIIVDGTTNKAYTATEKTKLSGIASGAQVNVKADWNAVSGDAEILNKPTIPTQYTLPTASDTVKGGIKIGARLTMTGEVLSADVQTTDISGKVDKNADIVGATKTKITYDAKGLVTAGADATTADIADSTNRRYVTDAQLTNLHAPGSDNQDLSPYLLITTASSTYEPIKGVDDNYVTDAEKANLHAPGSDNQDLSPYLLITTASSTYEPLKGTDDNYVTDAEKIVIGNTSNTNSGDNAVNSLYSGLAASKQNALSGTGFVKISGTTISYDNSTYLTSLSGAVLVSQASPQTIGDTTNRLAKLWATDITVTNAIVASITGSAPTLTNTRTLWGQNFDGSANVSGAMTGLADMTFGNNPTLIWGSNNFTLRSSNAIGVLALKGSVINDQIPRFDIFDGTSTTVKVSITGEGRIALGTTISAIADIRLNSIATNQSSLYAGIWQSVSYAPASTPSAGANARGLLFQVSTPNVATDLSNVILYGALGQVTHGGSGNLGQAIGMNPGVFLTGSGNVTTSAGITLSATASGGGAHTTFYGFRSGGITLTGGSTMVNSYAFYADAVTGATNNYSWLSNAGLFVVNETGDASSDLRVEGDTNTHLLITDASADCVGINITVPVGKLDVVQSSTTAAIPTLKLTQSDLSEEFIRFSATVGAGNPIDTAALGTYYGKVSVYIEGVGAKKMAVYNT